MTEEHDLKTPSPTISSDEWKTIASIAKAFMDTTFFDRREKGREVQPTLAELCTMILFGQELGIGPVSACTHLNVIYGKLSMKTALMHALAMRVADVKVKENECSDEQAVVHYRRHGEEEWQAIEFTMDQVKKLGVYEKNAAYKSQPRNMLTLRAIAQACRRVAPDALMGIYTDLETQDIGLMETGTKPVEEPDTTPVAAETVLEGQLSAEEKATLEAALRPASTLVTGEAVAESVDTSDDGEEAGEAGWSEEEEFGKIPPENEDLPPSTYDRPALVRSVGAIIVKRASDPPVANGESSWKAGNGKIEDQKAMRRFLSDYYDEESDQPSKWSTKTLAAIELAERKKGVSERVKEAVRT